MDTSQLNNSVGLVDKHMGGLFCARENPCALRTVSTSFLVRLRRLALQYVLSGVLGNTLTPLRMYEVISEFPKGNFAELEDSNRILYDLLLAWSNESTANFSHFLYCVIAAVRYESKPQALEEIHTSPVRRCIQGMVLQLHGDGSSNSSLPLNPRLAELYNEPLPSFEAQHLLRHVHEVVAFGGIRLVPYSSGYQPKWADKGLFLFPLSSIGLQSFKFTLQKYDTEMRDQPDYHFSSFLMSEWGEFLGDIASWWLEEISDMVTQGVQKVPPSRVFSFRATGLLGLVGGEERYFLGGAGRHYCYAVVSAYPTVDGEGYIWKGQDITILQLLRLLQKDVSHFQRVGEWGCEAINMMLNIFAYRRMLVEAPTFVRDNRGLPVFSIGIEDLYHEICEM